MRLLARSATDYRGTCAESRMKPFPPCEPLRERARRHQARTFPAEPSRGVASPTSRDAMTRAARFAGRESTRGSQRSTPGAVARRLQARTVPANRRDEPRDRRAGGRRRSEDEESAPPPRSRNAKTCSARLACRELTRGSTAAEAGDRKQAERTRRASLRMTHRTRANTLAHQLRADAFHPILALIASAECAC